MEERVTPKGPQVFLSHASEDEFEAGLLQMAIERLLEDWNVRVWRYRDRADSVLIKNRLLTRAALIGAATVRERLQVSQET